MNNRVITLNVSGGQPGARGTFVPQETRFDASASSKTLYYGACVLVIAIYNGSA